MPSVDLGHWCFFDELQVDVGGGVIGAIEFAAVALKVLE
jgi:hypothetical protein